jgi:regulatory protein
VCVTLSDGSSFFVLKEVQLSEAVYPGAEVDAPGRARLERISAARAATRSALALLSRASASTQGLRLKLIQRGHDEAAIAAALDRARELGYLDDARFAEDWARLRIERHPEGRAAVVAGLRERGVPRELAEAVGAKVVTDEVEEECLLRAIARAGAGARRSRSRFGPGQAGRLAARLRALGFPGRLVRRHVPDAGADF